MRQIRRYPGAGVSVAAVVTVSALLVACGGDNSGKSASSASTASANSTASTSVSASSSGANSASATTTAGSSGSRSGQTITVGDIAMSGALAIKAYDDGFDAAIKYINANGGINGATVKVDKCDVDGTPEKSVNCANKLIDDHVPVAFVNYDIASEGPNLLAQAGVPMVSSEPWSNVVKTNPGVLTLGAAQGAYVGAALANFKDHGAKTASMITVDSPNGHEMGNNVMAPVAKKVGIDLKVGYYGVQNPDFSALALSSAGTDGAYVFMTESYCTNWVKAIAQSGYKGLIAPGSCSEYIEQLPADQVKGTFTSNETWLPSMRAVAPAQVQSQIDVYTQAMKDAGHADSVNNGFAATMFASAMELGELLKRVPGDFTRDAIAATAKKTTTIPGFMRPDAKCNSALWPSEPSVCRASLLVSEVDGNKTKQPVGNKFIDASPYAV